MACSFGITSAKPDTAVFVASKAAAAQCRVKLNKLEDFAFKFKPGQTQTTRFSEDEINSYLALDLSADYHPCLKSLVLSFEENKLNGIAAIDFDRLGMTATSLLPKLASFLFSGTRTIAASGQLICKNEKAHLKLEQALFDGGKLPKPLVEKIISAVGRKQHPPFDPLQPSQMPYEINKVEVHTGYIIVYQ